MAGTYDHPDAEYGRYGDTMMVHATPGEQFVPKPVLDRNPHLAYVIAKAIRESGADPEQYVVGGKEMSINPYTGKPEFGFFKKIKRLAVPVALALGAYYAAPYLLGTAAAGTATAGTAGSGLLTAGALPTGAAVDLSTLAAGKGALSLGAGSTLGGAAGASLLGKVGAAAKTLGTTSQVLSAVKPLVQSLNEQKIAPPTDAPGQPEFTPRRPEALTRPSSLNELADFSPMQQRASLATRGLNVGLGGEEQNYYRNLLQRSLISDSGQVEGDLLPIESQYLSRQGYNTSDLMELLRGMSK